MILETARLRFRLHQESDLEPFCAMQMDPAFRQYVGGKPRSLEAARQKFWSTYFPKPEDDMALWATEWKATGAYIGYCGIYPRFAESGTISGEGVLAFYLAQAYWGRGLATEAGIGFLDWGFRIKNLQKVWASTEAAHLASQRVLEKLGFRFVGQSGKGRVFYEYELPADLWPGAASGIRQE